MKQLDFLRTLAPQSGPDRPPDLSNELVSLTACGLYCRAGGFHVDPHRPVEVAVTTHAHSDHARRGSKLYLCHEHSVGLLRERLGPSAQMKGFPYRVPIRLGEVSISFHPAGHILGSAQVRIDSGKRVCVVSGDYKRDQDPTCEPFEVVECDTFITEATFGLPQYRWEDTELISQEILQWWEENARKRRNSVLHCYSLGKSQRVLAELFPLTRKPVWIHPTMDGLTRRYREAGVKMVPTQVLPRASGRSQLLLPGSVLEGELILAPPSSSAEYGEMFGEYETAFASGWMSQGGRSFGRAYSRGFPLSDHADWPALVRTVQETRAKRVYVLHQENEVLVRHLRTKLGVDAHSISRLEEQEEEA